MVDAWCCSAADGVQPRRGVSVCAVMPSPQKKQRVAAPRAERAAVEVEAVTCTVGRKEQPSTVEMSGEAIFDITPSPATYASDFVQLTELKAGFLGEFGVYEAVGKEDIFVGSSSFADIL
eukprot:s123_g11.t1